MTRAVVMFFACLMLAGAQEQDKPKIKSVRALPSEAIPEGCKVADGGSGFLMTDDGRAALTDAEIGQYVRDQIKKGLVVQLFPQVSGRIFSISECRTAIALKEIKR